MPASQAQIDANRRNSRLSTGPTSTSGKERSRRNSMRHGTSGHLVVVHEDDAARVERRAEEFAHDLAPKSALGRFLTRQLATLSVRIDRSASQESLAIAHRTRHAVETFDREQLEAADRMLETLGEDPRILLRRLRDSPEGIERLIEAWQGLRADLTRETRPLWTPWHRERAENLTGNRIEDAPGSEIARLSNAFWDRSSGVLEDDTPQEVATQADAQLRLIERIDAEIAGLEAHYETLDFETLDLDRAEAPGRALFDSSKEATLARRYEAENTRKFFKTLDQIRQVEAEAADRPPEPANPAPPKPYVPLGSFGGGPSLGTVDRIGECGFVNDTAPIGGLTVVGGSENGPTVGRGPA